LIKGYLDNSAATSVTVCGHSLGGALATLLTLDVGLNTSCRTPTAYTYASPRTGDHIFAGSYNAAIPSSYRIENRQGLLPACFAVAERSGERRNRGCADASQS
jgi:predicted lipase